MSQKLHLHCLFIPVQRKVFKKEPEDGDEDSEVVIVIDERDDGEGDLPGASGSGPGSSGVKGE